LSLYAPISDNGLLGKVDPPKISSKKRSDFYRKLEEKGGMKIQKTTPIAFAGIKKNCCTYEPT
jgi:hypothetical protein